jgi:hypothetical protein
VYTKKLHLRGNFIDHKNPTLDFTQEMLCRERKEGKVFFAFSSKATSMGFVHNKAVSTRMQGKQKHYKVFISIYNFVRSVTNITLCDTPGV